jgi:hypothetical protein
VQNKAADAAMLTQMSFTAAMGHADGIDFKAAEAPEGTSGVCVGEKRAARSRFASLDYVPYGSVSSSKVPYNRSTVSLDDAL